MAEMWNQSSSVTRPIFWGEAAGSSKRQVFLRSYQFSRNRSLPDRIKASLLRVRRLVWFRLRSARKLRRFVWSKLGRRRPSGLRFVRLVDDAFFPCFC